MLTLPREGLPIMTASESTPPVTIRRSRRVQDTILAAVHRACDEGQLELAGKLLRVGEESMAAEPDLRRRRQDLWGLIAAHERLWHLRHEDAAELLPPPHLHPAIDMNFGAVLAGE
jgi:hypothetical protein